ncbi:MAG: NIPSNAP family protein [Siculibacillus sp.]|nr:NIPSNAP family protein [Siculibacillus sp.]
MRYEILTLTVRLGGVGAAVAGIDAFSKAPGTRGRLLGCWTAEVGTLNRVVVLRVFESESDLHADRMSIFSAPDPFGAGEAIVEMEFETHAPFPWCPPPSPGAHGRVWEMRTYRLKHGGLAPTIDAWEKAMAKRGAVSPLALVTHALDGVPRFTHFWPYASFDDRFEKRSRAVAEGVWPPVGGPQWLTGDMVSTLLVPTSISPLA